MKKFKKETIAAKAGIGTDAHHGSIVPPLYLSSNFKYEELGKEQEYEYTRETNPSRDHLINALTQLENGVGGEILSLVFHRRHHSQVCLLYTSPSPRDRG